MSNGPVASQELRLLIERKERLIEEKKNIQADIKDVDLEAKSRGFDVPTMNAIIKLRAMDTNKRRESEALLDTYKAALGMLDGTPLGRWALDRLEKSEPESDDSAEDGGDDAAAPPTEAKPAPAELSPADLEDAKTAGQAAAAAGQPVTANPYPARDLRRAAWDEAWCAELGSDGMDIPDALKAPPKPKKASDKGATA